MFFYIIKVITMKLKLLFTTALLILAICALPLCSMASAEELSADFAGNTDTLISIKNPESAVTSTSNKACVISAVAADGTTVTLYRLDSNKGTYVKMYADGKALESVVGAAGLYAQNIDLTYGTNNILVVATSGTNTEVVKLEITLIKNNLIDTIKNIWQNIIS